MNKTKQCKTRYKINLMNPNKLKTLGQKTQDHATGLLNSQTFTHWCYKKRRCYTVVNIALTELQNEPIFFLKWGVSSIEIFDMFSMFCWE